MTSLVERLRNISRGDHEHGCQGREYVCSCDYDETSWKTAEEAAVEIERLQRVIAWANNSLFGSHGFFLSLNGGEPDEHHLDRAIESLKEHNRNYFAQLSEARRKAFEEAGQKAREYAAHYPEASDGRNTFIIFAEWAEARS